VGKVGDYWSIKEKRIGRTPDPVGFLWPFG